jgi:hypothetical protein
VAEECQRPWARNAGIGDEKRFRSINLIFHEISEKGVRCDSKIVPFYFKIVRYHVEIVHYDSKNTVKHRQGGRCGVVRSGEFDKLSSKYEFFTEFRSSPSDPDSQTRLAIPATSLAKKAEESWL